MAKKTTYRQAVEQIENILAEIENDELDVDDLSTKVKKVSGLITICKDKLRKTETDVEAILNEMETE